MTSLEVEHVIVLGHAHCGGIRAFKQARQQDAPSEFIGPWMTIVAAACAHEQGGSPEERARACEQAVVLLVAAKFADLLLDQSACGARRLAATGLVLQ